MGISVSAGFSLSPSCIGCLTTFTLKEDTISINNNIELAKLSLLTIDSDMTAGLSGKMTEHCLCSVHNHVTCIH